MYQVLVDKELFCDSRVDDLVIINPVVNLEINKAGTFSFTIPKNHPYIDRIGNRKSMIEVYRDEEKEPLFEGICTCISNDFYGQRTIECEGSLSFFNDTIQRPAHWKGKTVRGLLETYIARHNSNSFPEHQFEVGAVTVKDSNDYITCYTNYETTMTALKEDLVDDLGGFFRIRHENGKRYIDYLADSPNTNSQVIKIGENLLDLNTTLDSREIVTSVIPLGAKLEQSSIEGLDSRLTIAPVNNGTDYLINESTIDTFGIVERVVIWDDVTDAAILKRKGQKYLSDTQFEDLVINAKVVDLHLDEKSVESLKLFDNIRAVSKVHGLDRFFMLTKMKIHLNNPENDEITLGTNSKATLSSRIASNNAQTNKRFDEIKTSSMLEQAKENASSLIKAAQNGYVTFVTDNDGHPKELLIMDTNDINTARKVWRWNVNGLGYSSTGYNGRFDTAITMDGSIVADFVKAGMLLGIEINNGNGTFKVDSNGNVIAKSLKASGAEIIGKILGSEIIGCIINNGNGTFSVDEKGNVIANSLKSSGAEIEGTIESSTINGCTINGSEITSEGTVTFNHSDYSQSDLERVNQIIYGTISPTFNDYMKYDINGDGIINSLDMIMINKLINGTDYSYNIKLIINPTSDNNVIVIETNGTPSTIIGRKGINTDDISCDNVTLKSETGRYRAFYDGNERSGVSGTFVDRDGKTITVAQGIVVGII